jgi:hypothetical protein
MPVSWMFGWLTELTVSGVTTYTLLLILTWLTYKAIEPLWSPLRKVNVSLLTVVVCKCYVIRHNSDCSLNIILT